MKVFIGLTSLGFCIMGEFIDEDRTKGLAVLKNAVRLFEAQSPQGAVMLHFHPDPYFLVDEHSMVEYRNFIMHRVAENSDDRVIRDYQEFLVKARLQKSGLVTGGVNPDQARRLIRPE